MTKEEEKQLLARHIESVARRSQELATQLSELQADMTASFRRLAELENLPPETATPQPSLATELASAAVGNIQAVASLSETVHEALLDKNDPINRIIARMFNDKRLIILPIKTDEEAYFQATEKERRAHLSTEFAPLRRHNVELMLERGLLDQNAEDNQLSERGIAKRYRLSESGSELGLKLSEQKS
jgi:hypothetical protein